MYRFPLSLSLSQVVPPRHSLSLTHVPPLSHSCQSVSLTLMSLLLSLTHVNLSLSHSLSLLLSLTHVNLSISHSFPSFSLSLMSICLSLTHIHHSLAHSCQSVSLSLVSLLRGSIRYSSLLALLVQKYKHRYRGLVRIDTEV